MTNRIDIAFESLKTNGVDKHVINIIANFSAEEWIQIIEHKQQGNDIDMYNALVPFLIYTYDEEKSLEIAHKSSMQLISYALVDAWYAVVYGNRTEKDLQPSFLDIARSPALLHILEGHMLKIIERAEYQEDISVFITSKFKMLQREYFEVVKSKGSNKTEAKKVLIGAVGNSAFPPITDYSLDRLESVNNFVYFLTALELCIHSFNSKGDDKYEKDMIQNGKFNELIEKNSETVKARYQNEREFNDAFVYVLDNFETHMGRFSSFMFESYEQELLAYIYREKGLDTIQEEAPQQHLNDIESEDDFVLTPLHHIAQDSTQCGEKAVKTTPEHTSTFKKLKNLFGSLAHDKTENENHSLTDPSDAISKPEAEESSFDNLVISTKKKSSNIPIILSAIGIIAVGLFVVTQQESDEKNSSIIDKSELTEGASKPSEFRTIIER
ncbi:hypothetical protein OTK49_00585 [Vibrio coralliirubri]|uniref:hypothetical protein n=1 Tax=Vibrio coralliirubri TaxID=1516159 RepID=UPI0022844F02|nr:hypothetical protein [Vibrio coralliirubri]MCY9861038.1 hypothetical protein [Vibrio coralliirubri]